MRVCFKNTWEKENDGKVKCTLCPFLCSLDENQTGFCRVRSNRKGNLVLDNYGLSTVPVLDRIQKRPIYLYDKYNKDDKTINSLSLGSTGCNNRCPFCQNYEISQVSNWEGLEKFDHRIIVEKALEFKVDFISFSFNEVIVIYEYFCDIADLAKDKGLKICVKTAGYISKEICPNFISRTDIINLDIKPLQEDYMKKCGILDHSVVENLIQESIKQKKHIEFSHILIQGVNDNIECMDRLFDLFERHKVKDNGLHLLRHYPAWKSNFPLTSDQTLIKWASYLREKGLSNVFNDDVG